MLNSPDFLAQSFDVINPNFFELEANQWIVETTLEYFNDYKVLPTLEVFKVEMNKSVKDDTLRTSIVESLRGIFQKMKDNDLDYIKDSFLDFAKNQTLKSAIIKSVDLLLGDSTKARNELKWEPKTSFEQLVDKMVVNDLKQIGL